MGFEDQVLAMAESSDFSGVLRVNRSDGSVVQLARGLADRANERVNALDTRFGVASATKGLTALAIMSLIEDGELSLDTPVRSIVGDQLPVVDAAVTIDHLLTHRSGIGDFLDEETLGDIDDHVFGQISAHRFVSPRDYLELLNAYPQRTTPGSEFAYNNSAFVVLSLVIELVRGSFHQSVQDCVLAPAGMTSSGFFRSDSLPADTAFGYLVDGRTNVFHLPVIGAGDGGVYLTLDDIDRFWSALFDGQIVNTDSVEATTAITTDRGAKPSYGRGFWLGRGGQHVWLEGMDAGVSFQSGFDRATTATYAVMSNTSGGVWPLVKVIETELFVARP